MPAWKGNSSRVQEDHSQRCGSSKYPWTSVDSLATWTCEALAGGKPRQPPRGSSLKQSGQAELRDSHSSCGAGRNRFLAEGTTPQDFAASGPWHARHFSELQRHARRGWRLFKTINFAVGAQARTVEREVLAEWRVQGWRPVRDGGATYDGYTETAPLSQKVSVESLWRAIQDIKVLLADR